MVAVLHVEIGFIFVFIGSWIGMVSFVVVFFWIELI